MRVSIYGRHHDCVWPPRQTGRVTEDQAAGEGGLSDLTAARGRGLLEEACNACGLDPTDATLVRLGEYGVFRLREPIIARVSRSAAYEADAYKEIAVARYLASVGYPAARALDVEQPVVLDASVVTFWESVSDTTEYATIAEVADLVRRLHQLEPPDSLSLPRLQPFGRTGSRLASASALPSDDRAFLTERLETLQAEFDSLTFVLPRGMIHGDASIGNVIRDQEGKPALVDLDGFAVGPREWDLAITATYYDSFGWHTRDEYQRFVDIYGFDVMDWPGYPTLRAIRELIMVSWLSQKTEDEEHVAAELRRRIHDLRTGSSRKGWQPY